MLDRESCCGKDMVCQASAATSGGSGLSAVAVIGWSRQSMEAAAFPQRARVPRWQLEAALVVAAVGARWQS